MDLCGLKVPPHIKFLFQYGDTIGQYSSRSEALSNVLSALITAGYDDGHIARLCLLEEHGISDLPRGKGLDWFHDELKQARRKADCIARQAGGEPKDAVDLMIDAILPAKAPGLGVGWFGRTGHLSSDGPGDKASPNPILI